MDITTDGLGLMLTVWDLSWLPSAYSIQVRYLILKSVLRRASISRHYGTSHAVSTL
ncbi:hypothetical protein C8R48DRAFT_694491 [Suillus tomentosus]|nr:hypothetical protein C8R48DRAFT_694491 [Suillus tomentosus]